MVKPAPHASFVARLPHRPYCSDDPSQGLLIRPLVTAGAAWHNDLVTLTADGDLTETKGFKSEDTSQYVGVGAEVTPLNWLAVRAGFRADMKGNDSNVFTGGVGFAPFNTVHVDLMGLYGEDETWGAGAQLSMTF
jgi:hypothetical protein